MISKSLSAKWYEQRERETYSKRGHTMQTYTTHDAQLHFNVLLDCAQREPIRIVQGDRVLGVMMSAEDYDAM